VDRVPALTAARIIMVSRASSKGSRQAGLHGLRVGDIGDVGPILLTHSAFA
jgi:hypothetical protein